MKSIKAPSTESVEKLSDSIHTRMRYHALRRPLGGRLRNYRAVQSSATRLENLRKALGRGELMLNGFNRWRLTRVVAPAVHWTFTDSEVLDAIIAGEIAIVRREAGDIEIAIADETNAETLAGRVQIGLENPHLIVVRRDWIRHPRACEPLLDVIRTARQRGVVVHIVAALGKIAHQGDHLHIEAWRRRRQQREPLLTPPLRISKIERHFGQLLKASGLDPTPQLPVAQYFLDFAVFADAAGTPIRLDIEVDGRRWHEDLPGRRRPYDERRDRVLRRFGWRPVRFWADEIETDANACIGRIQDEVRSANPLHPTTAPSFPAKE